MEYILQILIVILIILPTSYFFVLSLNFFGYVFSLMNPKNIVCISSELRNKYTSDTLLNSVALYRHNNFCECNKTSHQYTNYDNMKFHNVSNVCIKNGWKNVALVGEGDLRDIAVLVANSIGVHVMSVESVGTFDISDFDAVLITDVICPQESYDFLKNIGLNNFLK